MIHFEELFINAYPSIQTILYDGWILQLSKGYAYRANSVYPLQDSDIDLHEKVRYCEMVYQNNNLYPVFRISPFSLPGELDDILENKGYTITNNTNVMSIETQDSNDTSIYDLICCSDLSNGWIESYYKLNNLDKRYKDEFINQFKRNIPKRVFTTLCYNDEVIACAMLVFDRKAMGIFDVAVAKELRRQSIATHFLKQLLMYGYKNNADYAYLSVMLDNVPAVNLYKSLGFKTEYSYHYRVLK